MHQIHMNHLSPNPRPRLRAESHVETSSSTNLSAHRRRKRTPEILKPEEYGEAVDHYSKLTTGAGQNFSSLGPFLTREEPRTLQVQQSFHAEPDLVIVYPLSQENNATAVSPSPSVLTQEMVTAGPEADVDSADERQPGQSGAILFHSPNDLYQHPVGRTNPESLIVFLHGFMSPAWINTIGARFSVDPELFCRHLDFRSPDDNANTFSTPSLPSSSLHLLEMPIFTIGWRDGPGTQMDMDAIDKLRNEGAGALSDHHQCINRLDDNMGTGESMIRDFYVFDQRHFVVEQRISICLESGEGNTFRAIVWIDAGPSPTITTKRTPLPWDVQTPKSRLHPVIQHRHRAALKAHLLASSTNMDPTTASAGVTSRPSSFRRDGDPQSLLHLSTDYGRFLHQGTMSSDALYSLNEVFHFAASSQMQFLNLIEAKLDKYTSLPHAIEYKSLQSLKYTERVLERHIQKTRRELDGIKNARASTKWPSGRDRNRDGDYDGGKDTKNKDHHRHHHGSRKAETAATSLEQDFAHLLHRALALHARTRDSITSLMSSISIAESQRGIEQNERVGKLTFLAFIFVPLSFTTSFFGMNVSQLQDGSVLGLREWGVVSLAVVFLALVLLHFDFLGGMQRGWGFVRRVLLCEVRF